jgi:alkylation response protein AidB-like acyl-CoA dehydrogenase
MEAKYSLRKDPGRCHHFGCEDGAREREKGISLIIVETKTPGFQSEEVEEDELRSSDNAAELF